MDTLTTTTTTNAARTATVRSGRRRVGGLAAAVAAATVAGVVGLGAAGTADAAFLTTYFHPIVNHGQGTCSVRVGLDVAMSEADARAFIAHPGEEATVKLYGDDEWFDNALVAVPVDAPTWPQAWAGGYSVEFAADLPCSRLNEDNSVFDNRDEIYARVTFADFRTGRTHTANSGNRTGYF
jgi:hypothetical protein